MSTGGVGSDAIIEDQGNAGDGHGGVANLLRVSVK
jgi:hypothetical protein